MRWSTRCGTADGRGKLDEPPPENLLPDISALNHRRGPREIFSRLLRERQTLRDLVVDGLLHECLRHSR
ncbi:hypothetical protein [Actinoplanes sp. NPDC026623]|uniref:hypothetical protein n=1 Tax=Actinoplanes sp. NPDC026623 TaxID=3155610 RepID=UPI0033C6A65C